MSTNWQDVPRDPMMDDDELESLYRRTSMQSPALAEDSKHNENGPKSDVDRLHEWKKLPVPSYSKGRRGKVA